MQRAIAFCIVALLGTPAAAQTLTFSANRVTGGCYAVNATLTLPAPAPAGGTVFTTSVAPPGSLTPPPTVTVDEGASTANFVVDTSFVGADLSATLTATASSASAVASLTLTPNGPLSIDSPARLGPEMSAAGSVTLRCGASPGGQEISMSSSDPVLQVPVAISFAGGDLTQTYSITTSDLATQVAVSIVAAYGGVSRPTTTIVKPPTPRSFTYSSTVPIGGDPVEGVVGLDFPAPASGVTGSFSSGDPALAWPASGSFAIAPGSSQGRFAISTAPVINDANVIFTATVNGTSRNATLTLRRNRIETIAVEHRTVSTCRTVDAVFRVRAAAPAGGLPITIVNQRTDLMSLSSTSVVIPEGAREASITVDPVGSVTTNETAAITATIDGQANPLVKTRTFDVVRISPIGCP